MAIAMAKRCWFPPMDKIIPIPKGLVPYRYSLFIGITAPFLNFPVLVFNLFVLQFVRSCITLVMAIAMTFWHGVNGTAFGFSRIEQMDDVAQSDLPTE